MTRYLTYDELVVIAEETLGQAPVIRDEGLLDAAAHRPRASVLGADAYPSIAEKASALLHSVVTSHPLLDGNKRLGWAATAVFLSVNAELLHHSHTEAVELVLDVARGDLTEVAGIAERIRALIA